MATGTLIKKYRVWNTLIKEVVNRWASLGMLDTPEIHLRQNGELVIETEYSKDILDSKIFCVEWWTGEKDDDGVDIYEGDKIGTDKKSFAINFRFINTERTLTDAEVENEMKAITEKLTTGLNAEVRK